MKILFQGDSITDAYRTRNNDPYVDVGIGYPRLIKSFLLFEQPGKYEIENLGISGNRIVDIYARMKADILNLKPDVMSLLIGVNDVWHELAPEPNGVDAEKFYKIYDMLIEEIKAALPDIKIMIMEPFILKGPATTEEWEFFATEVPKRAEKAKMIAEKYNLTYIPLQEGFDKLCESEEPTYWLRDGVHPTAAGHEYIKREWLKAFNTL